MARARSCGETGLKKGPWSREEDDILVSYIRTRGHGNWRSLPKQAGLARCGKSCRLRWLNYLRPDIKRGNFTQAEEETIIALHEELGNRWSAIAARLPGRTDNEIKNVWNTHLKKRAARLGGRAEEEDPRAARRGGRAEEDEPRGADSPPQSSGDASSAEEKSIPWEELLESLDNGDILPRVDDGMDFWRRLLMGEEGLDSMIF